MCQIRKETDTNYSLKFEFYIVPDITTEENDSRIFIKYVIFGHSESTKIKHCKLFNPWKK